VLSPSQRKLYEYHLARLKDKNPQVRIQSINELLALGNPEALKALEDLYRNDPDPDVRKTAVEAGRQLFIKQQSSTS
jgi:HEAT repeat protein